MVNVSAVARPTSWSVAAGSVNVPEAAAVGVRVVDPLVDPSKITVPLVVPETPSVREWLALNVDAVIVGAVRDENAPVFGDVPPIGGGDAIKVVKPEPLTARLAEIVPV